MDGREKKDGPDPVVKIVRVTAVVLQLLRHALERDPVGSTTDLLKVLRTGGGIFHEVDEGGVQGEYSF